MNICMALTLAKMSKPLHISWPSHGYARCVIPQARKRSCSKTRGVIICRPGTLSGRRALHLCNVLPGWQAPQLKPVVASLPFLFCACWQASAFLLSREACFLEQVLQAVLVASLHPLWTVPSQAELKIPNEFLPGGHAG